MNITKIIKMQGGSEYDVTDEEALFVAMCKEEMVHLKRLDCYINKKYVIEILRHPRSYNKYIN